jgi:hypothetical protein
LWPRLKLEEKIDSLWRVLGLGFREKRFLAAGIMDGNGCTTYGSWTVSSESLRQQQLLGIYHRRWLP